MPDQHTHPDNGFHRAANGHRPAASGLRIRIEGSVQGVGFRPWVHNMAAQSSLRGRVFNDSDNVTIEAFGDQGSLERFVRLLRRPPMPAARVDDFRVERIADDGCASFSIVGSHRGSSRRPSIPPDLATCPDCLAEVFDPSDRRFGYALTNCTRCGPRYTIATDVPYDRERTSMAAFPMCDRCREEYEDVTNRRFHAQPNACPDCGPRVELVDKQGSRFEGHPIATAAALLRAGRIVAVKGIGGYHLACNAGSEAAVAELRLRKHREAKPLAVMVANLAAAERFAILDDAERALVQSQTRPIVLVRRRPGSGLAVGVSPDSPLVGLLLAYTPLHALLLAEFGGPLVMTSGNVSDEPMCIGDDEALERLGGIADAFLRHDRAIVARADDSIVRTVDGSPVVLRRARGLVPDAIRLARPVPLAMLACGGHLKNAFCIASGNHAWLGPHLGDLVTDEACEAFDEAVERFSRFVGIRPEVFVHDCHPDYFTTLWASAQPAATTVAVQHHHAHVASAMAEHGIEGPVLGLAWDGTGDGGDGTAWGGELLLADFAGFRRLATLRPMRLAGGEAAIREVWRLALAVLDDAFEGDAPVDLLRLFRDIDAQHLASVRALLDSGFGSPAAHGAGRWFDAIGAIAMARPVSRFEGEIASTFGMAARRERRPYGFAIDASPEGLDVVDLRPMVREAVADVVAGRGTAFVSDRFHATLAAAAAGLVTSAQGRFGDLPVVLTGGCFQNDTLSSQVAARLDGCRVLRHGRIPPGDGGLALGQAMVAAAALRADPCVAGATAVRPTLIRAGNAEET